jgi:lysophospholipid acyltransferase (LPLAT)-like uncharacterized protein
VSLLLALFVLRALLGVLLGVVARVWLMTLRVRVVAHPALAAAEATWLLAFFHGTQWPLLAWKRRRRTVVLVSLSADGAMQARALRMQGLAVVRGSSSRGGARGLAALVRAMRQGCDAAFAVDGPRGPYGVVKPGILVASRAVSGVIVPMGAAIARGLVLTRAWDRFAIAWPFSRVVVVLGAPLAPTASTSELHHAIRAANARAWTEIRQTARSEEPVCAGS